MYLFEITKRVKGENVEVQTFSDVKEFESSAIYKSLDFVKNWNYTEKPFDFKIKQPITYICECYSYLDLFTNKPAGLKQLKDDADIYTDGETTILFNGLNHYYIKGMMVVKQIYLSVDRFNIGPTLRPYLNKVLTDWERVELKDYIKKYNKEIK